MVRSPVKYRPPARRAVGPSAKARALLPARTRRHLGADAGAHAGGRSLPHVNAKRTTGGSEYSDGGTWRIQVSTRVVTHSTASAGRPTVPNLVAMRAATAAARIAALVREPPYES